MLFSITYKLKYKKVYSDRNWTNFSRLVLPERNVVLTGEKKIIGVCVTSIHKIAVHRLLTALGTEAEKHGYSLHIFAPFSDLYYNSKSDKAEQKIFDLIPFDRICALVIFSEMIKYMPIQEFLVKRGREANIPVLAIKGTLEHCSNIQYDAETSLADIIRHLIEHHHCKHINFMAGVEGNPVSEKRIEIYRNVLAEYNYPIEEERIGYGDFWGKPARQATQKFLSSASPAPDAIVCANDAMGIAVCDYLSEQGIRVPEDIIVTGLGGLQEREFHMPLLTTAIYDPTIISTEIIRLLNEMLQGKTPYDYNFYIPCKNVYTESCGCDTHGKLQADTRLVKLFSLTEQERGYRHATYEFTTYVNAETTLRALAKHFPNYVQEPGLTGVNLYINTDFASLAEFPSLSDMDAPIILLKHITEQGDSLPLLPRSPENLWTTPEETFYEAKQLLTIPLNILDDSFGFLTLEYHGETIIHESLFELVMTLNHLLDNIKKRTVLLLTNQQVNDVSEQTIQSLAEIVEAKSEFTGLHVKRVSEYTRVLAEAMGYSPEDVNTIRIASMMHDIGKINIPAEILEKPGKLTPEEFDVIKTHIKEGERLLRNAPGKIMETAKIIALEHHEKWDGTGYMGRKGLEIHLDSRIVALADVFDALVSKRPYKKPFSDEKAKEIIVGDRGSHFDPDVVDAFVNHFNQFLEIHAQYPD